MSAPSKEWPENQHSSISYTLPGGDFHSEFHTFALEWDLCEMRWYVDDVLYSTKRNWWSTNGPYPAPFDQRFHLLLNVAVGGNLPGPPDATTQFPQELIVDYVRVYQQPTPVELMASPFACLLISSITAYGCMSSLSRS